MSKKNSLDSIEIKSPCFQPWEEMRGNEQIRFCDHCSKDVHNISAFRRKDARRLVAQSNGSICIRYVKRPDGRIEIIKKQLHQIAGRAGIAAGVLGTSLSISTLAYAQAPTADAPQTDQTQTTEIQKSGEPSGAISGTISDQNGAVLAFALVTISCEQSGFFQTANSNADGFYEFKNLAGGVYKLKFEAGGFESKETTEIAVGAGAAIESQNAQLSVQTVQEQVNVGGEGRAESVQIMGIMVSTVSIKQPGKLYLAVEADNLEDVKKYVAAGKRVNTKGYEGNSPLHVAVENGNAEIAEVLLNAGAKINGKNSDKRTPLMMLDEDASPELVNLLLRHGAKINATDKQGNTALIFAASSATSQIVQTLIGAGANINAVNKQGETALMNAAESGDAESVQALLGAGANANARSRDGKTAFDLVKDETARQYLIAYVRQ